MSFRKSLNEEVAAALNEQICIESSAAFLYFSMASWSSVQGLTGMAKWFRGEAQGELTHMNLFVDYLNDRDYQAKFATIEAPESEWANPIEAFDLVRTQEHKLLQRMNDLIDLADKHNDHLTHSFLTQFVPQQIADTAEADDVHDRLMLVGGDGHGLILIDQELGRDAEGED
ncbi:MAG: ferritin [Pirellulales bacterium]